MNWEKRTLQIGAAAIACAVTVRLCASGQTGRWLGKTGNPGPALIFMETGRVPGETLPSAELPTATATEAATEPVTVPPQPDRPVFSMADAEAVKVSKFCDYELDVQAMLQQPLEWDLYSQEPAVLILHTHGTESYTESDSPGTYHTEDITRSVVAVGEALAAKLEENGISVIHDLTLHDVPSYNAAYDYSRQTAEKYLETYPNLQLILDLHRDSVEDRQGNQMPMTAVVNGEPTAKLMAVVGTDAAGSVHPRWRENMALAVKFHAHLEEICPGICRPINFRSYRYNQDLNAGSLLFEIGAAGNTRQEAVRAAEVLAQAIIDMAPGTRWTEVS